MSPDALAGLSQASGYMVLAATCVGVFIGLVVGMIPGMTISTGIIVMLPVTFVLPADISIALLLGVVTVSALLPNNQATLWTSALALQVLIAAVVLPSVRR